MSTIVSKDGTKIGFDKVGAGPAVILVDGALGYRGLFGPNPLEAQLADHFTVYSYDRRGRGESGDTAPYAVQREIEDLEALINEAGGPAFVVGFSSGAALAMGAAISLGDKISKLAMYEAPYSIDEAGGQAWQAYIKKLGELLAADRRGDAVALFMMLTGASADQVDEARRMPMWPAFEAVAPTLAYDHIAILGEDASVPIERAASVAVPTLVMNGGASYPFMHIAATAFANAIPNAQHRILEGQTHEVSPEALAPVLVEFFTN